ncbi:hypothetical protein KQI91_06865 [Blautia sp. MSJ-19]|nr:hypothetical protein [Blautia sp. MSJ-19]
MEGNDMPDQELKTMYISWFMDLQRIKKSSNGADIPELEYQIKGMIARLSSMGVNVEDLTL